MPNRYKKFSEAVLVIIGLAVLIALVGAACFSVYVMHTFFAFHLKTAIDQVWPMFWANHTALMHIPVIYLDIIVLGIIGKFASTK